jgi:glycosyltransferase involved in cell wall biosynthesis
MSTDERPYLSIVIKALNEEAKIAAAIESSHKVQGEIGKVIEIVVADSGSTDRTVEIALRHGARVVQLANPEERGCGMGLELGFQHAGGQYVYFLDGDMELMPGFIPLALQTLEADPALAGVGGLVRDTQVVNGFDRIRVNNKALGRHGPCAWLEGGGLYRRAAIVAAGGYAADRNLKGYEEAELGMRLAAAGWSMCRLPTLAVSHTGHAMGSWQLMLRHWRSGRAMSAGVLLRLAFGKPWFTQACRLLWHPLVVALFWLLLPIVLLMAPSAWRLALLAGWVAALGCALLALALRKRDLHHALLSVGSWHYGALAIVRGLFIPQVPPVGAVACVVLDHGTGTAGQ